MGTMGLLLLLPFVLFVVVAVLILSGMRRSRLRGQCGARPRQLGGLRGNRPVFCALFFGAAAVLLLVPAVLTFRRNRREQAGCAGWESRSRSPREWESPAIWDWARTSMRCSASGPGRGAALESCVNARAVAPSSTADATVGPAGLRSPRRAIAGVGACTARERDPNWRGRRFVLRETASEVAVQMLFHFGDRDTAGPSASPSPPARSGRAARRRRPGCRTGVAAAAPARVGVSRALRSPDARHASLRLPHRWVERANAADAGRAARGALAPSTSSAVSRRGRSSARTTFACSWTSATPTAR